MFKKTLTAAIAALTLTGATLTTTSSAQAGGLGKFIAAGVVGAVVGAVASRAAQADEPRYVARSYGDRGGYRQVGGGYDGGCGFRNSPVFDAYGNRVGFRRVPAC